VTVARGLSTVVMPRILDMLFIVAMLPLTLAAVPTLPANVQSAALATGAVTLLAIVILVVAANQRPLAARVATAVFQRLHFNVETWVKRVDDLLVWSAQPHQP
jgi:hypothetical protein